MNLAGAVVTLAPPPLGGVCCGFTMSLLSKDINFTQLHTSIKDICSHTEPFRISDTSTRGGSRFSARLGGAGEGFVCLSFLHSSNKDLSSSFVSRSFPLGGPSSEDSMSDTFFELFVVVCLVVVVCFVVACCGQQQQQQRDKNWNMLAKQL